MTLHTNVIASRSLFVVLIGTVIIGNVLLSEGAVLQYQISARAIVFHHADLIANA